MTKNDIETTFEREGFVLSEKQIEHFLLYAESLVAWNVKANLISKKDEARILERHFLESAALSFLDEFKGKQKILDLGTGGGFPGIPLKIVNPELKLGLLDSKQKKCLFLKEIISELDISADVFWARAEDIKKTPELGQRYDIVVSRAVTHLSRLYNWAKPYIKPAGLLITIKGSRVLEEIEEFKEKNKSLLIDLKNFPIVTESTENLRVVFVRRKK